MKELVLLPLILVCLHSKGQDSSLQKKQPQTELEKAQIKIGAIIKKEYVDIYYDKKKLFGGKFSLQVLNITDAASGIVLSGLYVQYTDPGNSSQTFSSFIDLDEVPGLLKFIDFLDKTSSENPATYTEYIFNSRDLQLYGYYDPTRQSPWVYGFKLDKFYSSRSTRQVDLEVLDQIKRSINNAKDNFKKPLPEVKEPGKG